MIRRVASFTSFERPSAIESRPSINSERDWRVFIDAGTLRDMGASLLAPAATGVGFANSQRGYTPTKFSSKFRTSPKNLINSIRAYLFFATRVYPIGKLARVFRERLTKYFVCEIQPQIYRKMFVANLLPGRIFATISTSISGTPP